MGLLTITASRVEYFATALKDDIEAYSFPLYGSVPKTYKPNETNRIKNVGIVIGQPDHDIACTMNNQPIYFNERIVVELWAKSESDLEKIYADFLNMLAASTLNVVPRGVRDKSRKGHYIKAIEIKRLK